MLTVQEYAARAVERQVADLIKALAALPEDRRHWKPLDRGRTATDQMAECAMINGVSADIVAQQAWGEIDMAERRRAQAALDTPQKAEAALKESTARLVAGIRATPDAALEIGVTMPWETLPLADVFLMPFWNMAYHEGQINYIKTLAAGKGA